MPPSMAATPRGPLASSASASGLTALKLLVRENILEKMNSDCQCLRFLEGALVK